MIAQVFIQIFTWNLQLLFYLSMPRGPMFFGFQITINILVCVFVKNSKNFRLWIVLGLWYVFSYYSLLSRKFTFPFIRYFNFFTVSEGTWKQKTPQVHDKHIKFRCDKCASRSFQHQAKRSMAICLPLRSGGSSQNYLKIWYFSRSNKKFI